jgi:hypothetical protein
VRHPLFCFISFIGIGSPLTDIVVGHIVYINETNSLSLTNLQVSIGGQNVLNSTLNMTYENLSQQVHLAEQLTSSDFGVSTGLISQAYWEASKWYFVNVERSNIADKLQPRNLNVSFNNNSNVAIDVFIFTFYSDQLTIDVETGKVTKYFFLILL